MLNGHTFGYGDEIRALLPALRPTKLPSTPKQQSSTSERALVATDKETHSMFDTEMASSTDSSATVDEEVRRLYERYQAAESDAQRHQITLEMGKPDGRRHAEVYAALEDELFVMLLDLSVASDGVASIRQRVSRSGHR
nr:MULTISPECIES: hypothetical protein [Haloferax]